MKSIARTLGIGAAMLFSGAVLAGTAADDVRIDNPYVRAVPAGQPNSAAFMTLVNSGGAHAVVGASTPIAKMAQLHTHRHENGMMKMRQIPRIDIEAGGSTTLQPGGLHVMLMGLKKAPQEGETVSITLKFEDGSTTTIEAPVKSVLGGMKMKKMNMQGGNMHMKH